MHTFFRNKIFLAAILLLPLFSCRDEQQLPAETKRLLVKLDDAVESHSSNVRKKSDSLKRMTIVTDAEPGKERYEASLDMRALYMTFDLDSAIHYGRLACQEADRMQDRELMSLSRLNLARLYVSRGNLQDALPLVFEAETDTTIMSVRDCYLRVMADIDQVSGRVMLLR